MKTKWGFHARLHKALSEYSDISMIAQHHNTNYWKLKYFSEEADGVRNLIKPEELQLMKFDFRFWIGQPVVIDGRIIVKSGLLESSSRDIRFIQPIKVADERWSDEIDIAAPMWSVRGNLTGHPCEEEGIEWFLDEPTGNIQWGFLPNLWPAGTVSRLDNWGWQISNPNVVMRAIDSVPPQRVLSEQSSSSEWDEAQLDEIEKQCSKNSGNLDDSLWKDLLDSLETVPLRSTPMVNGVRVVTEIPRAFIEQYV